MIAWHSLVLLTDPMGVSLVFHFALFKLKWKFFSVGSRLCFLSRVEMKESFVRTQRKETPHGNSFETKHEEIGSQCSFEIAN